MLPIFLRLLRRNALNSAVDAVSVVINPESRELSFEVKLVPEQYLVQQLLANRSDHPLNEGMRYRNVRNRLHLLNVQYAQVGQPGYCQLNFGINAKPGTSARPSLIDEPFGSNRWLRADNFAPLREAPTHDLAVVHCL